jgi:hypothetical protein
MLHRAQKKLTEIEYRELLEGMSDKLEEEMARELAVEVIKKIPKEELRKLFVYKRWMDADANGISYIFETEINIK